MLTDCYFTKGTDHETCQDYSVCSGDSVFLADGCSSASNSDMGARILSMIAKKYNSSLFYGDIIERDYRLDELLTEIGKEALEVARLLELNVEALFSTLLFLNCEKIEPYIDEEIDYKINCAMIGDGVAAFVRQDNSIRVYDIDFSKQAPKYLAYRLFPDFERTFWELSYNNRNVTIYDIKDGKIENKVSALDDCYDDYYTFCLSKKEFRCGAIMSDGVKTFTNNLGKPVLLETILPTILDFKQMTPNFLKRRMNRFLKENTKNNISHYDDFSIAAIIF